MVTGNALFLGMFNNLAFFILLVAVYGVLYSHFKKASPRLRQAAVGLAFGLLAIACMHVKIPVAEGVIVDQRNTVVALSGAFGGPLSAVLCAFLAGSYRIHLGGTGALAGVVGVGLSALAGAVFYSRRDKIDNIYKAALSALAATVFILPGFLFYKDLPNGWVLLKAMALPYGSGVYIGLLFVGLLLARQEKSHLAQVELQASERRYRDSQERLDLALSGANEGIWDWDIENNTLHFDHRYYRIAGYSPGEFPAAFEEWEKRVHPDDIQKTQAAMENYLSGDQEMFDVQFRFLRKDGGYMWIQGRGKIVARNEHGDPVRFTGTHADISQWKRIEQSLRIHKFSFDRAAVGIYRIASDARILEVNDAAARMIGYTRAELADMSIVDIDPNVTEENWRGIWQRLLVTGADRFETAHRTKDGRNMPIEIHSNLLEYDGRQYSICFVQDITQRKQDEEKLRSLRNYLSNIIDSMPSVLVGVDREGAVTQWNRRAEQVTGIRSERARSRHLDQVFPGLTHEMDRIRTSIRERRLLRDSKVPREGLNETRYEDVTIYPLIANGVEGAVIRVDDVTERVRLEEMMIQSEKMLSVGGLAAGMAHEINNPLAGILQNASVLENRLSGDLPANHKAAEAAGTSMDAIRRYMAERKLFGMLENIRSSGRLAAGIVKNMLSFARKSDKVVSSKAIGALLDQTLDLLKTDYDMKKKYDFKQIEVIREYNDAAVPVPCEASKIQQVFMNILRNGAEAMADSKDGQKQPTFVLRVQDDGDWVRAEIEDNGPGMDEGTRRRIFEPFFTTKPPGQGTGLGLSVSYFIVTEDHDGEMSVHATESGGTRFVIRLPKQGRKNAPR